MHLLVNGGKKFKVGIIVLNYNIPDSIVQRFFDSVRNDAKPKVSTFIYLTNDYATKYHNGKDYFSKYTAQNRAIETISSICKVIICADVDLLIPPGYIDKSYEIACRQPFSGIMRNIPEDDDYTRRKWNKWKQYPLRTTAHAPWNALTVKDWYKVGGWNEAIFSRGMDKNIGVRIELAGLNRKRADIGPLMHVPHPRRTTNVTRLDSNIHSKVKSATYKNFLSGPVLK
jgi:hypothetical protein